MGLNNCKNIDLNKIIKRTLLPVSERYQEIKRACLKGDYLNHFVEHNFHKFDNAEKIFLYEYCSDDYDVQQAYQMIKEDLHLFKYKECIILFNVSNSDIMVDDYNKVVDIFDNIGLTLMWGVKKKLEILFLCC